MTDKIPELTLDPAAIAEAVPTLTLTPEAPEAPVVEEEKKIEPVEMDERLLTEEEQSVLVEMPQRGLISVPSRKGELFRPDYGFKTEDFGATPRRATEGTPYAYSLGL